MDAFKPHRISDADRLIGTMTHQRSTNLWLTTISLTPANTENATCDFWAWHLSEMEKYPIYHVAHFIALYGNFIIFLFGVPGNILTLLTLFKILPWTSTIIVMSFLAVMDAATLTLQVNAEILHRVHYKYNDVTCCLVIGLNYFIPFFPRYLVGLLSCERLVAVCFPLKATIMCTVKRAKQSLLAIALFLAAQAALPLFVWKVYQQGDNYYCTLNSKYRAAMAVYRFIIGAPTSFYIPYLVLLVSNIMIVTKLLSSHKDAHRITEGSSKDDERRKQNRAITTMLLAVSITTLVCLGPSAIALIVKQDSWLYTGDPEYDANQYFFNRFRAILETANSGINFILYFLTGKRFRDAFITLIFCQGKTELKDRPI